MHAEQHRDPPGVVVASALALFVLVCALTGVVAWFLGWFGAGDDVRSPLFLGGVLVAVILGVRFVVRQLPPG